MCKNISARGLAIDSNPAFLSIGVPGCAASASAPPCAIRQYICTQIWLEHNHKEHMPKKKFAAFPWQGKSSKLFFDYSAWPMQCSAVRMGARRNMCSAQASQSN
jgi:hypothetical protein